MVNSWFRLYAEFADDPKVQSMDEVHQRRLVMLFCLQCEGTLVTLRDRHIAFRLRVTERDLAESKAVFIENGFIDEQWNLLNWRKRQYVSDSSAERTRRWRERTRTSPVTISDGVSDGGDTSDTDTDTDTDTDIKNKGTPSSRRKPSQKNQFQLPQWVDAAAWAGFVEMRGRIRKPMTPRAREMIVHKLDEFRNAGYDVAAILDYSTMNDYQGVYEPKPPGGNNGRVGTNKIAATAEVLRATLAGRRRDNDGAGGDVLLPAGGTDARILGGVFEAVGTRIPPRRARLPAQTGRDAARGG